LVVLVSSWEPPLQSTSTHSCNWSTVDTTSLIQILHKDHANLPRVWPCSKEKHSIVVNVTEQRKI
jgi:hypothetical protein